jgi:hypothetical protein
VKKFLIILGIVVVILIISILIIPQLFKGQIAEQVKKVANKNLNATLNFEDIGLSFFKNFPDFTLSIEKITIINHAPFDGDTLARIKTFDTVVNLFSLISGDAVKVVSIELKEPMVYLKVLKNGTTNWEITKASQTKTDTSASAMNLALQLYSIEDGKIFYQDESSKSVMVIDRLNHNGRGDLTKNIFKLNTETNLELTYSANKVKYINSLGVKLEADLAMDFMEMKFTLEKNKLRVSNIQLTMDGFVSMPKKDVLININLEAAQTDFKDVLALIPAVYLKNFEELRASGEFTLNGNINGVYSEEQIPGFNLNFNIKNGNFNYADIPTPVEDVQVNLTINNPGTDLNGTIVNLKKLHMRIADESFDAQILIKTPTSDPYLDAAINGKIDLKKISNLMALQKDTKIGGLINSNLKIKGNLSALEKKSTKNFQAEGGVGLKNITYTAADLPETINVSSGKITLTSQFVNLENLDVKLGKSDLRASGSLQNLIQYVLKDQKISGQLKLNSNYFDVNPWISDESDSLIAVELPGNIDFVMNSDFKEVRYDKLILQNVKGLITLKNKTLNLDKLNMNLLGGNITASGSYNTNIPENPKIEFDLDVNQLGFSKAYQNFVTVQKFAPMTQFIKGDFNAQLSLKTDINKYLTPKWNTLTSVGGIQIDKANIYDFQPLNKLADILKIDILRNPALNNVKSQFEIKQGRMLLKPFDVKIDDMNVNITGSNGIDKSISYSLRVDVPTSRLKGTSTGIISQLFSDSDDMAKIEKIPIDVSIGGTFSDPTVNTTLSDATKKALEKELSEKTKDLKEEAKKKLLDLFKKK